MVGASKILTVSYGTFSCTLEGFDDPFNTMKAIAEYFRDLAAGDRYFGAEPPQPDAAMLHRIAEREIQRRVEAKIQENGVILRAGDEAGNMPAAAPAPVLPALDAAPLAAESPAEKLRRLRETTAPAAAVLRAEAGTETTTGAVPDHISPPAPVAEALPEAAALADELAFAPGADWSAEPADEALPQGEALAGMAGDAAASLPADELLADEPLSGERLSDEFLEDDAFLAALAEPAPEPLAAEVAPAPGADELADLLPESGPSDLTEEVTPEEDWAAGDWTAEDADDDLPAATADEAEAGEDAGDEDAMLARLFSEEAPVAEAAPAAAPQEAAVAAPAVLAEEDEDEDEDDEDDALLMALRQEDEDDPEPQPAARAPLSLPEDDQDAEEAPAAAALDAAATAAAEKLQRARARVIRIRRSGAEDEAAPAAPAPAPEAADPASLLSPEAEAALQAELAALTAEFADEAPADAPAAPAAAPAAAETPRRTIGGVEEDRLLAKTNSAMAGEDNRRRRDAITHLKAAVAATEAERQISGAGLTPAQPRQEPYRADLRDVVRPKRPDSASERLSPLVLVSEQRIDRTSPAASAATLTVAASARPAAAPQAPVVQAPVVPVRPRRVSPGAAPAARVATAAMADVITDAVASARIREDSLVAEDDAAMLPGTEGDENIFAGADGFGDFAERLGARRVEELIEASAVYCATVLDRPEVPRPLLMSLVMELPGSGGATREDCLRAVGTLLRLGRLTQTGKRHFAVTDRSPYLAEAQRFLD